MAVRWSASGQNYTRALSLGTTTQFTLTCWVRLITDRNSYSTLWSIDNGTSDCWVCQTWDDGTALQVWDDDATGRGSSVALTPGVWYFVAVAINGPNGTFMVRAATTATPTVFTWSNGSSNVNAATLRIGDSPWGGEWWNGNMAAVKFWTGAALSQAELANEAWCYQPQRTANLRAWYPLVRAETTDYSGNGSTLSGGSGATTEDGPPIAWRIAPPTVLVPLVAPGTPVAATDSGALSGEQAVIDEVPEVANTATDTATLAESASVSVVTPPPTSPEVRSVSQAMGGGTSYTCSAPTGLAEDDVLLAGQAADRGPITSLSTPSGGATWQLLDTLDNGADQYIRVWWKVAGASEPSSYTMSQGSGSDGVAIILAIKDAAPDTTPVVSHATTGSGGTITTPGVTPPSGNTLEVRLAAAYPEGENFTFSPPSGFDEAAEVQSRIWTAITAATRLLDSGTATGAEDFTASTSTLTWRAGFTVAVAPAFSGPTEEAKAATDAAGVAQSAVVAASAAQTDTGSVTESATIGAASADTAALTDASALVSAASRVDAAALAETAGVATALGRADTATAGEQASVAGGVGPSDTAALAETATIGMAAGDTATLGAEAAAVAAAATRSDAGMVADAATIGITTAETGRLAETATLTAGHVVGDQVTLGETAALAYASTLDDTFTLAEHPAVAGALGLADAITLGEAATLATLVSDTAAAAERAALAAALPVVDAGALVEQAAVTLAAADQASVVGQAALVATLVVGDSATLGETSHLGALAGDEAVAGDHAAVAAATATGDTASLSEAAQVVRTEGPIVSDVAALSGTAVLAATVSAADHAGLLDTATLTAATTTVDAAVVGEAAQVQQAAGPTTADTAACSDTAALTVTVSASDGATTAAETPGIRLDLVDTAGLDEAAATEQTAGPTTSDGATLGATTAVAASTVVSEQATLAEDTGLAAHTASQDGGVLAESATVTTPGEAVTAADAAALGEVAAVLVAPALTDTALAAFLATITAHAGTGDGGHLVEAARVTVPGQVDDITAHALPTRRLWRAGRAGRKWSGTASRHWAGETEQRGWSGTTDRTWDTT